MDRYVVFLYDYAMAVLLPDNAFEFDKLTTMMWRLIGLHPELSIAGYRVHLRGMPVVNLQPGECRPGEFDEAYEGALFLSGTTTIHHHGKRVAAPGSLTLREPQDRFDITAEESPLIYLQFWLDITPPPHIVLPPVWPCAPELLWEVLFMQDDTHIGSIGWAERMLSRLSVILSHLLGMAADAPLIVSETAPTLLTIRRVQAYLERHLAEPIHMPDVAECAGVSVRNMQRLFQRQYHRSVTDYLLQRRMERAAALLLDSDSSVSAIGKLVGIPDPAYFCRRFTQFHGVSPRHYRATQRPIVARLPFSAR